MGWSVMTAPIDLDASLAEQIAEGARLIEEFQRDLDQDRLEEVLIRAWDGTPALQHIIRYEDDFDLTELENDCGQGKITLDGEHPAAPWLWKLRERLNSGQTTDAFITVDYVGLRYSSRVVDIGLASDDLGTVKITILLEHDYGQLMFRTLWPTPTTPAGFQPFKVWILGGPAHWAAATSLWMNLARAHGYPSIGWTSDPISITDADYRAWPIVIKPFSYEEAEALGVTDGLVDSRMKDWHEACADMLNDANVTTVLRRYLPGDPLPWPGAKVSYGALVVSFEYQGDMADDVTGGLATGIGQLVRLFLSSVVEGIGGGALLPVETGEEPLTGQPVPPAYQEPGRIETVPTRPYVFYPADSPGIKKFEAHLRPATGLRFTAGGHSMPGVNELISAAVQAIGDALAAIPLAPIPPLGGVADAILKPFYEDTVAAFMTVALLNRAAGVSWLNPYERFIAGADQAYTLSATMVLRTAIRASDTQFSASMEIVDGLPWRIGGEGRGDMRLGTRILMQAPVNWDDRIYSQRITKLQLTRPRGAAVSWTPTVGALGPAQDGFTRQIKRVGKLASAVSQLGVF